MKNWLSFNDFKSKFLKVPVIEYTNQVLTEVPEPILTVHIVTYNHVKYIKDTIEGVLNQETTFPIEIIIGDDESTDGTREICIEYANRYPNRIRLFLHRRENNIKILGRPCLIFQYLYNSFSARGKYIAVCSGDDYWTDKSKIQKQIEFLNSNINVNRTYCDHIIHYDKSISSDSNQLGEGAASTWMFHNIFNKIPIEYTQVIAEDSFLDFYLSALGDREKTPNLNPVVIRRHDSNVFMNNDINNMELQRINTIDRCVSALRYLSNNRKFKIKLITKLIDKNRKLKNLNKYGKLRFTILLFFDYIRYGLLMWFVFYILFYRMINRHTNSKYVNK